MSEKESQFRKCPLCDLRGVYYKPFGNAEDMFICKYCNFSAFANPGPHNRKDARSLVALGKANQNEIQVRELVCQRCDADYPIWYADNDFWNEDAEPDEHFLCPTCFIDQADKKGVSRTPRITTDKDPLNLLILAAKTIEDLAGQQTMSDEFYVPSLEAIRLHIRMRTNK
jgi:hypothetical protein